MIDTNDGFLEQLAARLDAGAQAYGNQSMARPVEAVVEEVRQELLDEVGWIYVLWCQAARKAWGPTAEEGLRNRFLADMRHRLARNDRGTPGTSPGSGAMVAMNDLQILAMDCVAHAFQVERRLAPIARSIEVAQAIQPYRGRRGGIRDPRSDD